ncbi:clarin-2 [Seriola lalandi dorsalis]|uniref:Clarin 2 n=1 Tax=Seriola lalandi dorsalis TaxID=1841481 RepID=A0A3B4WRU8_SERLL|nr:clarin-2 [Seriola lalandi dorsalis]XP_056228127.1 clarin-2 [Seriola aureovittata]
MPSLWKRITFSVASVLCVGSVALLVVALSTERWVTGRILCKTGAEIVNASHPELDQFIGDIYYGLFQGGKSKKCGLGKRRSKIYIFPKLIRTLNSGLHMMVILFLLVAIGFALVSLSFCIYNARKVPYQSIKGHKGLYLWNVIAAFFGALGVLCFLAAMKQHSLTERVANYQENLFVLVVLDDSLDWSFWLGVGSVTTHFAVCGVVAMSRFKLPKPEIKKPEEPTISALDLLY